MTRFRKYSVALTVFICLLFGLFVSSPPSRVSAAPEYVLEFDGVDDRVTFGAAPELGASTFTLELWFVRTGAGTTTTTGTGGISSAIPLLTKGRGQADGSNLDMNYFLGIESTTRVLAADFEDMHNGGNHPVRGRTAICDNIWYHAAATYDGTTWRLYLNGDLEAELVVLTPLSPNQRLPRADSIQHAGLATAMTSDPGTPQGFFKGRMHEARIWNVARNQADIRNTMGEAVFAAQPGLIGRWGLDEGSGTTVTNIAGVPNGTLAPAATPPTWRAGSSNFESGLVPGADVLQLTGTAAARDFVTFGPATSTLGAATFTIETWFNRSGPGVGASTGTGGLAGAIPLVTKGRSQGDNANIDMNYFLGIDATNVLAADFEEAPTATTTGGRNNPIRGVTPLALGWNHAAVTYDGANLQLYLNGVPDGPPAFVGRAPRADSIQHAALGTALDSNGVADGFFAGSLDEARIWNYARSATQIAVGATREIPNANGLLARWSFNDCCGRVIDSTGRVLFGPPPVVGGPIQGATLQGTGWKWAARGDATLSATVNQAPVVNAGADLTVTLPASGVLAGSMTDDGVNTGSPLSSVWSKSSGPGLVIFGDPTAPGSRVDFSATGTYVLRLTANDGELSASDTITIEVDGVANQAPVVEAGADQMITLPTDAVALSVVVIDDGLPSAAITAQWSTMSGPGLVTFTDATAVATTATFASEGTYVLQLTASDGILTGSDTLSVTVNPSMANTAVRLGGTNSYVTFGPAPQLGASAFTLEAWIRRDGAGVATLTGATGGVPAVPIVTRGMSEADGGRVDMNYFLGISPATGKLAADFEDTATGGNHPINGTAAIPADGSWHHVAASYDGTTWRLYLDGNQDAMLVVGAFTPRFDSIQHAAIGTALNSLGVVTPGQPAGRFHGVIDEVRIWNYARSGAQIVSGTNREIPSASGLLARWGLNEAAGTIVNDSTIANDSTDAAVIGTIVGTNYSWVSGAHVTGELNAAPVVDAGLDHGLTSPVGMLVGSATDDGLTGTPATSEWSQVSGPGVAMFGAPGAAITTVDFTALGTYVLQLTASDGELSATDEVTIVVGGVVNEAPVVEAGGDQTITLPGNVAALSGTATDDGMPAGSLTTTWSKVSGPGSVALADAAASVTTATFSMHGTYVLRLSATDGMRGGNDTLTITVNSDPANQALQFSGTNAFVALGPAPGLGAARFTIETWFRRDGAGIATSTGTGGVTAIPLVTKGMSEVDNSNRDMNYFLGIRQSDGVLAADFEDTATGLNHPVTGTTPILAGPAWHHAAVTYDGNNWRLYLDGQLEKELLNVGATPRADSIQHAALGTALNSAGSSGTQTQGFFHGVLDESRIWNYARSGEQISRGRRLEIAASTPGLLGRWGMNEGTGTGAANSAGPSLHGVITGSAWSWVEGAPFTGPANQAPAAVDDAATTNEDAAATIAVLGNDSDADGDALTIAMGNSPAHGTATANADGTVVYMPARDFSGPDSFSYVISDGLGGSATATAQVTVNAVNDAPVAADDAAATSEDTPVVIAVLGNDADGDSGSLTPMVVRGPTRGSLTVAADGTIAYAPVANFNGPDSFTYKANDGAADSGVATVTIIVEPINDAPAAASDSYSLDEDGMLHVTDAGVLSNDRDADGDSLSAMLVTYPAHGSLALNGDGSFLYTPDGNYNGADSFTYLANDSSVNSVAEATVSLTINPANDAPVAADDSYSTDEDTALVIATAGVLANDSDLDGNRLQAVLASGPTNGTLVLNLDGSFTYTPASNYNGLDSFSYRNSDGSAESSAATVAITVTAVGDAPLAADDAFTTNEDTGLNVSAPGVLANDSDAEGSGLAAMLVSGPSHGTLTPNADGSFQYTPTADYNGADSFTYKVSADALFSGVATVSITVVAINDAPVAVDELFSTDEDTVLDVPAAGVLANDTDADNDALTAILVSGPSHGAVTLRADGGFVYTPAADYTGADSFTYKARDASTDSPAATVALTVNAVNDVPFANADSYTASEDVPLVLGAPGVAANDTDVDGDPLAAASVVTPPSQGTLVLNADGSFTYTPAADYNGPDSFTYKLNDGTVDSNVATVTLTVNAVADAPVAGADSYSKGENQTLLVAASGVLANDSDVDGDRLTAVLASGPSHGTLSLNPNGGFSYTPAANFSGIDSFTYQASDGMLSSDIATVTITISGANDKPRGVGDRYTLDEDTTLTVAAPGLLANDVDIDSPSLTAVKVTNPLRGTLMLNADGSFTYTPVANYNGPDFFIYRARDEESRSNLVLVILNVKPVADAPVARSQAVSLNEDTVKQFTLSASDVDGNPLTFAIVTPPAHGVLKGKLPNVTYRPAANYNGPDSFTFQASDGTLTSNVATVSLTVTPVNDAPVASSASVTTLRDTGLTRQAGATDVDGDAVTYAIATQPTKGTLTLNAATGVFTYTPLPGRTGADFFRFRLSDGQSNSNPARIDIRIQ